MATGFDDLVEQLLYDVALSGGQGIDFAQLERAVRNFYKSRENTKRPKVANDEELLFSNTPPARTAADVDDALVTSVFEWLKKHPDIKVVDGRIVTNQERIWQAITGHGVDHSRIPPKMFECLQVIAAHGPDGVLQPDVRRITGQDKRSLPHRTDLLAEKGYITKEQVIAHGTNTTLLKLLRFTKNLQGPQLVKVNPGSKLPGIEEPIRYDDWYEKMLELFQSNDNIIALSDLIVGVGIYDNKWHTRCFRRCYNRLVTAGLLRKVSARIEDGTDPTQNEGYLVRCLQMIREPEDMDRYRFKKNAGPDRTAKQLALANTLNAQDQEPDEDDEEDSDIEDNDADGDVMLHLQQRVSPQWTPDLPHNNAIYNIIDAAGPDGLSSMALNEAFTGVFWRRPLDDIMLRMTDIWQHAQPSHLKHLTVVRDTGLQGKASHFIYRSLPNFEKAAELGQTSWKAVGGSHGTAGKGQKVEAKKKTNMDSWGFPVLKKTLFERNGYASLLECQALVKKDSSDESGFRVKRAYNKKTNAVISRTPTATSTQGPPSVSAMRTSSLARGTPGTGRKRGRPPGSGRKRIAQHAPKFAQDLDAATGSEQPNKRPRTLTWSSQSVRSSKDVPSIDHQAGTASGASAPPRDEPSNLDTTAPRMPSGENDKSRQAARDIMADISAQVARAFEQTPVKVSINPFGSYPRHLIKRGRRKQVLVAVFKGVKLNEENAWSRSPLRTEMPIATTTPYAAERRSSAPIPNADAERQQLLSGFQARTSSSNTLTEQASGMRPQSMSQPLDTTHNTSPSSQQSASNRVRTPVNGNKRPREHTTSQLSTNEYSTSPDGITNPPKRAKVGRPSNAEIDRRNASKQTNTTAENGWNPFRTFQVGAPVAVQSQAPFGRVEKIIEPGESDGPSVPRDSNATAIDGLIVVSQHATPLTDQQRSNPVAGDAGLHSQVEPPTEQTLAHDDGSTGVAGLGTSPTIDLTSSDQPVPATGVNDQSGQMPNGATALPVANDAIPVVMESNGAMSPLSGTPTDGDLHLTNETVADAQEPTINDDSADSPVENRSLIVKLPLPEKRRSSSTEDADQDPLDVDSDYDGLPALFPVEVSDVFDTKNRYLVKAGTSRYGGALQLNREKLALEIVRQAGGATPGDLQMVHIYTKVWQSLHKQTPDRKTVDNAINSAIASGQLRKYGFIFEDNRGDSVQRHVIMEPELSKSSKKAKAAQQEIMDSPTARFLASTLELERDMCAAATARETEARDDALSGRHRSSARMEPDPEYLPNSSVKKLPVFGTSYHGDFPTVEGITVKRTAAGIAAGQAEERLWKAPRRSTNIRRVVFRRAWEVTTPKRLLGNAASEDSDEEEDDDDDDDMALDQVAGMGSFGVEGYAHDPYDMPARYKAPRPQPTFFRNIPATHPSRQDSDDSDTDTEPGLGYTRRSLLKSHKPLSPPEWMQLSLPPEGLQSVLERAHSLGYVTASPEDSLFWQFQVEVDNVMSLELALLHAKRELQSSGVSPSVNHTLNRKHVVDARDNQSGPLKIAFVEGFLAVGKAEKLRAKPKTRKRLRGATTFDFSRTKSDWQFRHQFLSLPRSGASLHGTWMFNAPGHSTASPLHLPPSFQTPSPSTTLVGASRPVHSSRYNTRSAGEGRPNLQRRDELNEIDATPATPAERSRQKGIPSEEKRLLAIAIAVINILCGGATGEAKAKWELVSHCLSFKQEANNCRQRWRNQARGEFGTAFVTKTEKAIREPFLLAYERGELPVVNFQQLNKTDWPGLMEWAQMELSNEDQEDRLDNLPASRRDFDESYVISVESQTGKGQGGKDDDNPPTLDTTTSNPIYPSADNNSILEKSWIRALIATREESYDEAQATQKLATIPEKQLEVLLKAMTTTKSIIHVNKGRQQPGRNYVFHKHFLSQFDRWPGALHADGFLMKLAEAWKTVALHFQDHDKLDLKPDVTEAESTVLLHLSAHKRLKIAPVLPKFSDAFNAPADTLSQWGMGGYSHKPKHVEESLYQVPIIYTKTATFTSDHGLKANVKIPTHAPAVLGEPGFRIPLWIDIHRNFVPEIWKMVVRSLLHFLVYLPACTPASIEKMHDNKLWAWEVELVLGWMEEVGIAEKWAGGWAAAEWWFCAFMPEIVG